MRPSSRPAAGPKPTTVDRRQPEGSLQRIPHARFRRPKQRAASKQNGRGRAQSRSSKNEIENTKSMRARRTRPSKTQTQGADAMERMSLAIQGAGPRDRMRPAATTNGTRQPSSNNARAAPTN